MKKILVALMLGLVSIMLVGCDTFKKKEETEPVSTVYVIPTDAYVTDPETGLQYNKNSMSWRMKQIGKTNTVSSSNNQYEEGYQAGYEDALNGCEAEY